MDCNQREVRRFEQLLALNDRAFAMGKYVVAYGLLDVALDAAYALHDPVRIKAVETRALVTGGTD